MKSLAAFTLVVGSVLACTPAFADDTIVLSPRSEPGPYRVDAGLYEGMPAGLPAGIEPGIGLGFTRECGCVFAYGVRLAIAGITESSEAWTASDVDTRLRVFAALHHSVGRGELSLRLGGGTNIVYEDRVRNGGDRAGLTGDALGTRTVAALPAADLEAVVALHLIGPWLVIASAGPTAEILNSELHGGFVAGVAVGWQP
ncbi:MAG TPA: hypothetical protein VGG74_20670 [Kofleriaceae bacterium]